MATLELANVSVHPVQSVESDEAGAPPERPDVKPASLWALYRFM